MFRRCKTSSFGYVDMNKINQQNNSHSSIFKRTHVPRPVSPSYMNLIDTLHRNTFLSLETYISRNGTGRPLTYLEKLRARNELEDRAEKLLQAFREDLKIRLERQAAVVLELTLTIENAIPHAAGRDNSPRKWKARVENVGRKQRIDLVRAQFQKEWPVMRAEMDNVGWHALPDPYWALKESCKDDV